MNKQEAEQAYKRWLLERVLLYGESTLHLARVIDADPEDVRRDFESALATIHGAKR